MPASGRMGAVTAVATHRQRENGGVLAKTRAANMRPARQDDCGVLRPTTSTGGGVATKSSRACGTAGRAAGGNCVAGVRRVHILHWKRVSGFLGTSYCGACTDDDVICDDSILVSGGHHSW